MAVTTASNHLIIRLAATTRWFLQKLERVVRARSPSPGAGIELSYRGQLRRGAATQFSDSVHGKIATAIAADADLPHRLLRFKL